VKPNSKHQKIVQLENDVWRIHLKSSPTKGKANRELIKLLAKKYKVTKSQVKIKHGLTSKKKLIEIA